MNPRDISNALDMLLHMLTALAEGRKPDPADIAEVKALIGRIEASR